MRETTDSGTGTWSDYCVADGTVQGSAESATAANLVDAIAPATGIKRIGANYPNFYKSGATWYVKTTDGDFALTALN